MLFTWCRAAFPPTVKYYVGRKSFFEGFKLQAKDLESMWSGFPLNGASITGKSLYHGTVVLTVNKLEEIHGETARMIR